MKAYQLKVMIKNSKPPIWRRVIVPTGLSFSQLELVLNETMGWSGGHLSSFEFRSLGLRIEEPFDDDFMFDALDATEVIIDDFLDDAEWFSYIYDFGDWWDHRVTVEKILYDYPLRYPQIVKIKGDRPPEDCGGIYGYYELLRILDDPEDPMHEEMSTWMEMMAPIQHDMEEMNSMFESMYISDEPHLPMGKTEIYDAFYSGQPFYTIVDEDEWQVMQNSQDKEPATLDEWRKLYEVTEQVKELKPWDDFWDIELIGIPGTENGKTAYISILGHLGNCFGICVYEDDNDLNRFVLMRSQEQINASPELLMYKQNSLVCYWGNREELTKEQHGRIKELGYKYRGKDQWLYFLSFKEGFYPADLNQEEVARMTYYIKCLKAALLECRKEIRKVAFEKEKFAYVDATPPKAARVVEKDIPIEAKVIPALKITDDLLIQRLRRIESCDSRLEADIIIPGVEFKDKAYCRHINVAICAIVDADTGLILMHELVDPGEDPFVNMADAIIDYIFSEGSPAEIHVANDIMVAAVDHICKVAGIKVVRKNRLKHMEGIAKDFIKVFRNN